MIAKVDKDTCVGCGLCEENCPDVFVLKYGVAEVLPGEIPDDAMDKCREAAKACPVDAITIQEVDD